MSMLIVYSAFYLRIFGVTYSLTSSFSLVEELYVFFYWWGRSIHRGIGKVFINAVYT